jgi:hypothetical protein
MTDRDRLRQLKVLTHLHQAQVDLEAVYRNVETEADRQRLRHLIDIVRGFRFELADRLKTQREQSP